MKASTLLIFLFILLLQNCFAQINWERLNSPVNDDLHDLFFLNDSIGWAYSYGTGIVIRTNDGGVNWEVVSRLDSIYFEQIQFLDKNRGWICGDFGKILKTDDGGHTWIDKSIEESGARLLFYAMYFFSKDEGFVGGLNMGSNGKREYPLFKTTDGGESWIKMKDTPHTFLKNLVFLNDSAGFANGGNSIYKTENKGETWQSIYEGSAGREGFRGLYFINKNIGFSVNANGIILRTKKAGNSWEEQTITSNRLRSVLFINEAKGYIVGDKNNEPGVLYRTTSGGNSWEVVNSDYADLHRIKRSKNYLWIVGKEGTILRKKIEL